MRTGETGLIGTLLERRYRIDAPIARGGMSTVFRGVDTRLDRTVAIKVMDPKFAADPEFLSRFEFEARAVAGLKDPGLVAVYDQGHDGEHAFLVMELVNGGTLRELLRERGPMPPHAVRAVAQPVLEALGVAHRAGLVHRDVKPENILISDSGEVKIADFGLVRAIAAANATQAGIVLGTAAYLAPEQVVGGNADARSDVYATGVLMFEMLTGRPPFSADTSAAVALQRVENDVPVPSRFVGGIPAEFDELIARATARDPNQRFPDAAAMADTLREIAATLQLPSYRVPAPQRSAEHLSHHAPATVALDPAGPTVNLAAAPAGPMPTKVETRASMVPTYAPAPEAYHPGYDTAAPPRKLNTALIIVAALVVAALALGIGGWLIGSGDMVAVPDVNGMSQEQAMAKVRQAGLEPTVRTKYSDARPAGNVLGTDPSAGSRVDKNSTIDVLISGGRPKVPPVQAGAAVDDVEKAIRDMGLEPVDGGSAYSSAPRGTVAKVSPEPGTVMTVGSKVKVYTSKGSATTKMPDLRGDSVEEASRKLARLSIKIDSVTTQSGQAATSGNIVSTDPAPGEGIGPDSSVKLTVNSQIRLPMLVGMSVRAARQELEALGLQVDVRPLFGTATPTGAIVGFKPGIGSVVSPGDTVVLTALP